MGHSYDLIMSKLIILVLSLFGLLCVCVGQVVQNGQCDPDIPLAGNFDIQQFLGTWHEVYRLENPNQQGDCSLFEFTNTSNILEVSYSSVNNNFFEEAKGTVSHDDNTPKLTLSISSFQDPIDFWVLRTDSTYAITFACENISTSQRKVHIWVLGRQRQFTDIILALISTTILNTFNIPFSAFTSIDHSAEACHILPAIKPGDPIILPGQCDRNLRVVQDFDVNRFLGVWHQISSYETPNSNGTCVRAEYTWGGEVVNVLNSQVIDQKLLTIDGHASVSSTDNSAKLSVVLNIPGVPPTPQDLWILVSDYDSYAISYTCIDYSPTEKQVFSWILSRTRQLPPNAQEAVHEAVNSYLDLNYLYYKSTNQSDAGCFFYPEAVPNKPVVFRGQCESYNVQAMQNFEINEYLGTWHNIELYPSRFQDGTCSNALYELVDDKVAVVNSQVNNQRLETINAVAVLASTDGSAELVVTFPIAGTNQTVSTNYWVLDTDYTNYAFVYTCNNVNTEEMQVSSWKLSRTKQLTIASETAINEVINTVPILDQRYYTVVNQTGEGCFYFPKAQDDVPVVFPGKCDEDIDVVQNFDFTRFQGIWNEIQAYPKAEQAGHCVNHDYTFVDNTLLNLEYSSITDQFLAVSNGVVRRSSATDNSGKLTISITSANDTVKNIPFWVLETDYTDFAFAYSCENINQDFRGVWSWKLSRTKQLSEQAHTAINNVIANNIVLNNNYFRNIDQSDEACFYLPEIERGEPVVLPGQCNTTIGGIPNFNISKYVGRWRLIESYGSDFQVGTCNVDRYTLRGDNTLDVINSQVVNEQLATISGTATISSTDGSGQLRFNFPNRDEPFEYTILATDYESYALGYGCVNLENNQRRVYSWKMSRQNTLSQAAIDNIDQIIDRIQVLNNRFYYRVNRTDTGCFYFPIPNPSSSVRFRGQCDQSIPVVTNFKPEEYLGVWYDIESYPGDFQDGTCNTANYSSGNDLVVHNTQVVNQVLISIKGTAMLEPSTDESAKLQVTFNVQGVNVTANCWVLATDYNSYSLVYACQAIDDEYVQVTSWKLSRTRVLTSDAQTAINNVMNNIRVLDQRYFITRNQTPEGCFYFPEPQPNVPVMFPGHCDDSIAAMPNFNMNEFQGTWHEIEAYPKYNQPGDCINHQYSLSGTNTLNLQSSNVFEQTLNVTSSNVRFNSTDGSGRLIISSTLNDGTDNEISYWILRTDYTTYALAYSCVNINSDFRKVFSWKLSRTKELSMNANTTINNVIANINVLDNRYFEDIDQSDKACFHLPEFAPGDDIVIPGRCDPSIKGIPNFDISKYTGEWRLIESYGSDFQVGTCNVDRYTLRGDNTLDVTNSQVVNEQLTTISGTATISSTDGSGQLRFNLSNQEHVIFILDTDYDSYALAYGCTDLENHQRRVMSWKFSRSNTLSQAANDNINEMIHENEVLHQPYYYHVDRSPLSCFYFPEPDKNTPVRFRGQCDKKITVVPNFDVEKYLGLWHDIESYPMPFQDGDCPNAYYALSNSTTVTVYNTQVIDQNLDVINGVAVVASTDGSAKLNVTFNIANIEVTSNYWVLETDYSSYAFVYSCTNLNDDYMSVFSWKLSRTKTLTSEAASAINGVMSSIRALDERYFVARNQTPEGCFYFPKAQLGVPVVFPGQCDNSIAALANFNMNDFQGTWHEIAAYPKAGRHGQCFSQQFTVNATNSMRLDSFSVLNQAQSATEGHVTFASDDGSGKLNINIWVDGQANSIPYWILSTDYTDYALAYSCVNINNDYRGVWSWKLSRTKQLSNAGNAAINNAIANINVLRNDYYEDIQQTDSACFHLPEISPGDNVILPGRCDPTITGIPNFNITKYAGEWRLIESYGSGYQSGTCNVARYTLRADNTLDVIDSQVVNEQLVTTSGTATISSTDGSGQLRFNISNQIYVFFILDTDYDSYALAYGCTDLENQQRRVMSWKFSRSNTLSQAASDNINEKIHENEVLHQPYYYHVDRSPLSCFYFPEPDKNTPVRFRGSCDENIPVVPNFDVEKYLGLWHDIESYPMPFQDGDCPNAYYALSNSATVTVYNTQVIDQSLDVINGVAIVASTDGSAKLNVTFNIANIEVTSNYWVLETDYSSYAFVYSCTNLNDDYMSVASWKLSRTKTLTSEAAFAINGVMSSIRALDERYFVARNQTPEGCFYFPKAQLGVPVVFPGQCDNSIAALANFDMNDFQGTWHEIAAYPKADRYGQCFSQQFTVNATNSMRLDSFSVLNQAQSATEGHVTFANGDGSGKLNINIWVDGEANSIPYWILSTDYTDYALAYSCVNINNDYRGVWSWKLSRTRQLSNAGNAAINNAIANINVLRTDYYENIQQTDSFCFYFPELGPSDPVIFPGRCDPNIPVLQNFDATRYSGRWRLIESYYSNFQDGTCNAATYSLAADGSVIVLNTQVINEQLNNITGSAVPVSNDGSGKLIVTFPNSTTPTDYWILDTDYYSYALIYTCVDLPNDRRRVWSWKMSRTNTLTVSATDSINQIVNSVDVLDDRYYQNINRTESGCFYYPTPDINSDVIYPGQCDENIPAVPNFDVARYAGTWYDIESYPTKFQNGTCNTATYSLNTDGTLNVRNTQVVEQLLQTVTGSAVPSSNDGTAKFDVILTSSSGSVLTTKYWVLATDYETYSLVYSCRNIDDEFRAVYSWKLGRQPTLSTTDVTVINDIINNVQVLDQQHFVQRNHTEEACFYYPDNQGGDVIMFGQCIADAQVLAVADFDAIGFAGTWHEVARFPSSLQKGECTATEYSLGAANSFDVIQTSVVNEALLNTTAQAMLATDGRGVISVNINGVPFNNVYILATNYNEYALAYSCRDLEDNMKQIYSWKLSRSRAGLSDQAHNDINEAVNNNIDLFEPYYWYTSQDDTACFYYPVFEQLPLTIELPGSCNNSIRGVPNFNVAAYLGRWFEVSRYPQLEQSGQCSRAEYALLDSGAVSVVNSEVIHETFASMTGEANIASNDGSGLLDVTFNVDGETRRSNYYVLETNYISYALVYSCANLTNGNRRVSSWKLSRTTELSTQANATMDVVIRATQGLNESYYQSTSQSDESCFHYPTQTGAQVVLPGQCDEDIPVVPAFKVAEFDGIWYQIQRYDAVEGSSCIGTRLSYDEGSGDIRVNSVEVFNEGELRREGSGRLNSTDESGKFSLVMPVDDSEDAEKIETKIYILATDYEGYALAYSCKNIDISQRQVGVWQLSRLRTMSAAGATAIAQLIEQRQELHLPYFKPITQREDCPEPSSAILFKSSIIVIFVCSVLHLVW